MQAGQSISGRSGGSHVNVIQAMPQGGAIEIACDNVSLSEDRVVPLPAGRYVRIAVRDHGTGIPAEHLPRLFDPYFTTKAGGHGLGLASVYAIARKHGGQVTVSSSLGAGTTFEVYLPAATAAAVVEPPRVRPASQRAGGGRVLVMDDEPAVRRVAAAMLAKLGYDVETAPDGAAAVEAARAAREGGRPFDLLLMDLTVPGGMGGVEALARIRAFDPGAVGVATSGYSNDPVMASFRDFGFAATVAKPFSLDDLGTVLTAAATPGPPSKQN